MAKKNEIAKVDTTTIQPVEQIESLILTIRGKQVILDRDLARLYGVETKRLNQQVQRNLERFPGDFMFQLNKEEAESLRSQFVMLNDGSDNLKSQFATSSEDSSRSQFATLNGRGHNIKHLPYAFTENGIAMLSGVLRSPMAIATNIHIMRAFNAMRHFIGSHAQVFQRLEVMERNQLALNASQAELSAQVAENNKRLNEVFRTHKFIQADDFRTIIYRREKVTEQPRKSVKPDRKSNRAGAKSNRAASKSNGARRKK